MPSWFAYDKYLGMGMSLSFADVKFESSGIYTCKGYYNNFTEFMKQSILYIGGQY